MSTHQSVFPELKKVIESLHPEKIPAEREKILQPLIESLQSKIENKEEVRLQFICTHNSRRSHFSQVWAQTLAHYFNMNNVFCYSGGTESTSLFPMVAETLKNSGFQVNTISEDSNPVYAIKFSENEYPVIGFSKKFDDPFNPQSNFVAVLTCSQADADCPFIPGAEQRISIPYDDPKDFDNTSLQTEKYQETNRQIANELYFVFSKIKSFNGNN